MTSLPIIDDEQFDEVNHQGKRLKVGDTVMVPQAGQQLVVTISSLVKRQGHYWVGYQDNQHFCPWPLTQPSDQT